MKADLMRGKPCIVIGGKELQNSVFDIEDI